MKGLVIKEAVEADVPDLLALLRQPDMAPGDHMSIEDATVKFQRLQKKEDHTIYIALLKGRAVGTFTLIVIDHFSHDVRKSMIMEEVVVLEECRGQGIGQLMVEDAMHRAKEAHCYKLALSSNLKRTAAHKFYEHTGFTKHGYSFVVPFPENLS